MNFDPVADVYDATRGIPDWVAQEVVDRVVAATGATKETRFLELGVGTGRIAVPFVERGYLYTGIDISERMMDRLRAKVPEAENLTLVNGSITDLPFPDGSFDVVLAVHILHLVPEWKKALAEVRRVLAPNGYFVMAGNSGRSDSPGAVIRREWRRRVEAAGHVMHRRYVERDGVEAYLIGQDARVAEFQVATWERSFEPGDLLDALHARTFSQGWDVPQDILDNAHEQLLQWTREQYGALDEPVSSREAIEVEVYWWC